MWRYVGVILPATYDPSGDVLATISWLYIIYALVRVHSNDQTDRGHLRLVLLCSVASYISTRVVCAWVSPVLRADLTEPVPFWVRSRLRRLLMVGVRYTHRCGRDNPRDDSIRPGDRSECVES